MMTTSFYTPIHQIKEIVSSVRKGFKEGITKPLRWRKSQLRQLELCLKENEAEWKAALHNDLRANLLLLDAEFVNTFVDVQEAIRSLDHWAKPERKQIPLLNIGGSAYVYKEPLGVVLIISPWNYPLSLITRPLIGAIAAGNCVIIKPSEVSTHVAETVAKLFPRYLDPNCIRVVSGAVEETTELLKFKFDHILYTGNGTVGKIVMRAATEYLTPVTLELGGKSPCIVDRDVNMKVAVGRICFGKFMNCGQTCIAPDYIMVHEEVEDEFLRQVKECIEKFYGENALQSKDYGKIISPRHAKRLENLLIDQKIYYGGNVQAEECYVSPTIVTRPDWDSPLMTEEIFGPILPVLPYSDINDVICKINDRPKPLALYVFSNNSKFADKVMTSISFGGGCVNETLLHNICPSLPFGGVGESGIGAYNGRQSFETFTHRKGILKKPLMKDPSIRFPPCTPIGTKIISSLAYYKLPLLPFSIKRFLITVLVVSVLYLNRGFLRQLFEQIYQSRSL